VTANPSPETRNPPPATRRESRPLNPQPSTVSPDTRLIERWLPIAEIGEESVRERRSMTALPPTYYLHVRWARPGLLAYTTPLWGFILAKLSKRLTFCQE